MDILLINPGDRKEIYQDLGDEFCAIEPPVFAGLFATYLLSHGKKVDILDVPAMGLTAKQAAAIASNYKFVVLVVYGFQPSGSTHNMTAAGAIAHRIKEISPPTKVMMTGTHPAALPERTMREEAVDFVCDLEGPATILKTVACLEAGDNLAKVPSLWWRDGEHIVPPLSAEPLIKNLDGEMPGIPWHKMPMHKYRAHNWHCFDHIEDRSPYAAIHTSLGCPYKCSFCCINAPFGANRYRMWDPETVVTEIDLLVDLYGVKNIKFVDEMFVLNRRHVLGICDELARRDYEVNIWAYARVDTVQDDMLDRMRAGGVRWICLGIESASEHVRDGADKRYGNEDIIDVVRRIQAAGIYVIGNYMFGLPDDTIERMRETLDLALELNCEFANSYSAMAYPGSDLYRGANAEDLPAEWKDFSQHGYMTTPLRNGHCSAADIVEFRDMAWNEYFRSPNYLNMVKRKFGQDVVDHIGRMTSMSLPRKLVEDKHAA